MLIPDEDIKAYHRNPAVGSSMAKLARKSLRLFEDVRSGLAPAVEDKPCWQVGRIIHTRVLEPDRYAEMVRSQGPINPKTGKEYGRDTNAFAMWQAENPDVIMVEPFIDMMCHRMPDAVKYILRDGRPEVTIRVPFVWPMEIQCRPDWMRGSDDWDLKTIDDVDNWPRAVRRLDYWFSAGWYKMTKLLSGEFNGIGEWRWIFCEKKWPYRWKVVRMSSEYVTKAMEEAEAVALKISDAMRSGKWDDEDAGEVVAELPPELSDEDFTINQEGSISL